VPVPVPAHAGEPWPTPSSVHPDPHAGAPGSPATGHATTRPRWRAWRDAGAGRERGETPPLQAYTTETAAAAAMARPLRPRTAPFRQHPRPVRAGSPRSEQRLGPAPDAGADADADAGDAADTDAPPGAGAPAATHGSSAGLAGRRRRGTTEGSWRRSRSGRETAREAPQMPRHESCPTADGWFQQEGRAESETTLTSAAGMAEITASSAPATGWVIKRRLRVPRQQLPVT
jgi:hypothetical protein